MADVVHTAVKLLLFSIITTCVNGEDGQIFDEHGYDIILPCQHNEVCFQIWPFSTDETQDYIATLRNGEIQTAPTSEGCSLKLRNLTAENVGRLQCRRRPVSPNSIPSASPGMKPLPGRTETMQCVLLTYLETFQCDTQLQQQLRLTWVDESGAEIQESEHHHITEESDCAITLTINVKSPGKKRFRCRATVNGKVRMSEELHVRIPGARRGVGGGFYKEEGRETNGLSQNTLSLTVGFVGCGVLAVMATVFVVSKRKLSRQEPKEPCNTTAAVNPDEVVYAEIMLPVASRRVLVQDSESTEYACVRYI